MLPSTTAFPDPFYFHSITVKLRHVIILMQTEEIAKNRVLHYNNFWRISFLRQSKSRVPISDDYVRQQPGGYNKVLTPLYELAKVLQSLSETTSHGTGPPPACDPLPC